MISMISHDSSRIGKTWRKISNPMLDTDACSALVQLDVPVGKGWQQKIINLVIMLVPFSFSPLVSMARVISGMILMQSSSMLTLTDWTVIWPSSFTCSKRSSASLSIFLPVRDGVLCYCSKSLDLNCYRSCFFSDPLRSEFTISLKLMTPFRSR